MPGVKNQHYVPRFYLRSFTDDSGYLSVVRRDAGGLKPVFRTKPENVCAENYLYEVRRRESQGDDGFIEKGVIEDALGKIENNLAPSYRSLLSFLDSGKLPKGEECVALISRLAFLLASLIARHPKWLSKVRGNAGAHSVELLSSAFFSDKDISQMDLAGYRNEFEAIVELACLDTALFRFDKGAPMYDLLVLLLDMDCLFYIAPEGSEFITSSLPVHAEWKDESDENPCGIYFPLNPRHAVVFRQRLEEDRCVSITRLAAVEVDSFNRTLMNGDGLWEFLIARARSKLERLIEE
ncbi:DUF4238 domain-containing protein [Collinsella aerofaciens]|uniref:DUF4238 domain-containing protein n=1 Tax=Collinsella aerofaciens TaxID=74426 RepID=UPI00189E8342|nr:DUF4238 domain-containing protein [Collinsella aerofaciens]MDB1860127.1 DUF4238 domain-containing protein [Collinsella aerofaciens]